MTRKCVVRPLIRENVTLTGTLGELRAHLSPSCSPESDPDDGRRPRGATAVIDWLQGGPHEVCVCPATLLGRVAAAPASFRPVPARRTPPLSTMSSSVSTFTQSFTSHRVTMSRRWSRPTPFRGRPGVPSQRPRQRRLLVPGRRVLELEPGLEPRDRV